jgi:glucose 1-dehydrogenase
MRSAQICAVARGNGVMREPARKDAHIAGRLQGKVVLISGSDSGIGQAATIAFAREGAGVVVTYLEDERGANQTSQ